MVSGWNLKGGGRGRGTDYSFVPRGLGVRYLG